MELIEHSAPGEALEDAQSEGRASDAAAGQTQRGGLLFFNVLVKLGDQGLILLARLLFLAAPELLLRRTVGLGKWTVE